MVVDMPSWHADSLPMPSKSSNIKPPPGLFLDSTFPYDGTETPKGNAPVGTPTTNSGSARSSMPPTPLENPFLNFPGLFAAPDPGLLPPDVPSTWNYNPFIMSPSGEAMSSPLALASKAFSEHQLLDFPGLPFPGLPFPVDIDAINSGPASPPPFSSPKYSPKYSPKFSPIGSPKGSMPSYSPFGSPTSARKPERMPTGPAATVVRGGETNSHGMNMVSVSRGLQRELPEVSWSVRDWVATRRLKFPGENWVVTDTVQLARTADATIEEWERRLCQREKQIMVGKGTHGYQQYIKTVPKSQRTARDPQTPRVAEQCSKRAFDGRLKQWRILLHAYSPCASLENSPRASTRDSTTCDDDYMMTHSLPALPVAPTLPIGFAMSDAWAPCVYEGRARVLQAMIDANVPANLEYAIGDKFADPVTGVQFFFGLPEFDSELDKRAQEYLRNENPANFATALPAITALLEALRRKNNEKTY